MKECPTCHRPFGATKRTCFSCARPIARTDKWHIEGCYILHDDCQNPTMRLLVKAPQPSQAMLAPAGEETDPQ